MRGAVLYGPGDVRFEERETPKIMKPTDAVIRISATCVCGSDLWPYRGIQPMAQPTPMGHEYCGIVEEVGSAVTTIKPGQFVIGSFFASDNTCEVCRAGYQSSCIHRELMGTIGTQAERARVPLADGTLVATPDVPPDDLVPSFLAASDGLGAHSVIEAVGTRESMLQAIHATRPGGHIGYVGVTHGDLPGDQLFFSHTHLHGGPAPVRRFLPQLIDLIWNREIDPGKVFDLALPLEEVAEGYRAMDERRAIKALLWP